jgi:hypothetical protein
MRLLTTLASFAVVASIMAIMLVLRREPAREALYGPRTLVTDRIVTTELYFAFDSDSMAARLFGSPLVKLGPWSKWRDLAGVRIRPDRIEMGGAPLGMSMSAGNIFLIGPGPRSMSMSADSQHTGLQLVGPDNWHSWPVDTLRPRRWVASRGK